VDRANDIYENRVEKLLESMSYVELYELPTAEPWTLDIFLDKVKQKCKLGSKELQKKSTMVEDAIEDLIALALEFKNGGAMVGANGANGDAADSESNSSVKGGRNSV
jgi:dynein heavy chain